jgi:hypothetical protein
MIYSFSASVEDQAASMPPFSRSIYILNMTVVPERAMRLDRIIPFLDQLRGYRAQWLGSDLLAGLRRGRGPAHAIAYPAS